MDDGDRNEGVPIDLRDLFNGATLRRIIGLRDAGEAFVAKVKNLLNGDPIDTTGDKDVLVHTEDGVTGLPGVARLFVPMNMLWNLPDENDTAMIVRARDTAAQAAYAFFGDAGKSIPSWLRQKAGLWVAKALRLESTNNDVEIEPGAGKAVKIGAGATKKLALDGDQSTVTDDWKTWLTTVGAGSGAGPPPTTPMSTLHATSTKGKGE